MVYDAAKHEMHVDVLGSVESQGSLKVAQDGAGGLQLDGSLGTSPVSMHLKAIDRGSFTLVNRGFHWISEKSFIQ
jgi:hypothetical protein